MVSCSGTVLAAVFWPISAQHPRTPGGFLLGFITGAWGVCVCVCVGCVCGLCVCVCGRCVYMYMWGAEGLQSRPPEKGLPGGPAVKTPRFHCRGHVFRRWSETEISMLRGQSVSSIAQSCPTLCNPMNCSIPGLPVHHQLPEFTQIHVHQVGDAIQPSYPLSSPSPPAPTPAQHQRLFP